MNFNAIFLRITAISTFAIVSGFSFSIHAQQPRQEQLLNGLRVLIFSDPAAQNVSVKLRVHAGAAFDPQQKEGTMCLLSEAFFPNQDARDFFSEDLGGSFKIVCNYDYIELDATSKPESYLSMLETIANAVSNPNLDRQTTDAVKAMMVTRLLTDEKNSGYAANMAVRKRLFGMFPYGRPLNGSVEGLKNVDFADLKFAYERLFGADNATLAVSGNFPVDMGYRGIRRYFGAWIKSDKKVPSTFAMPGPPPTGTQIVESPDLGSTELRYAFRGVARNEKDFPAASVFARIIEQRARKKAPDGKADNAWVANYANVLPGIIVIGFSNIKPDITTAVTDNKSKTDAYDMIANALGERITEAEFAVAYNAAKAEFNKMDAATRWLDADTYKLTSVKSDLAAFDSLTSADVQRFADRLKQQASASVLLLAQKSSY